MASTFRIRARLLARAAVPIFFAAAVGACSSVPDWVDPTTWIGGDNQASSDQTSDAGTDQSTATGTDQSAAPGQETASTQASAGQTPDIAAIPAKPAPPSTADEQKQVAASLTADRAQAHYSADALRGGTEAAAAPPSAAAAQAPTNPGDSTAPASDTAGSTASNPVNQTAEAEAGGSPTAADNQAASNPPPPPAAPPPGPAPSSAAPASNEVASTDTASTSAPAAAPMAAQTGAPPAQGAPDMQATFAPSRAPALDPSVSQFVPQQILLHYRETASAASVPTAEPGMPSRHRHRKKTSQRVMPLHYASMAGSTRTAMNAADYSPTDLADRPVGGQAMAQASRNAQLFLRS